MSTDSISASSSTKSTQCVTDDSSDSNGDSNGDSLNSLLNHTDSTVGSCAETFAAPCLVTCDTNLKTKRSFCCNDVSRCVWGVILVATSISCLIFTPLDLMLWEKLNMRPGFPPYEWWADPPDEVKLRTYVFNITNHDRFLNGVDAKLNVEEIGPIVYLEKLLHSNIVFNENHTMTYTAKRFPIFLPEENSINLNDTIIVPNLAVLGLSSYLHNAPYLVRAAFRFMVNSHGSQFFLKKSIQEYLWDLRDPVLDLSKSLAPGLVPVNNMGMLARIYSDFTDEMTVFIGKQWGDDKFFTIDRFRGQPQLPGYDAEQCPDRIIGSTEGVLYRQRISKKDVLLYWRKTVCKLMPLYFDSELVVDSVPLYRFNLSESVFERVANGTDCYDTEPSLPAGLSDASKCYYDFPMVISFPHFYTGQPPIDEYVTGLEPDRYKHNSYVVVEPNTGTPFRSVARMQSNLHLYDLSGFSTEYDKFSNLIIPLFWAEYNQEGLPPRIRWTIYFMSVLLPPMSTVIFTILSLFGCYLIFKQFYIKLQSESLVLPFNNAKVNNLAKNKIFSYEKENFIPKP